MGEEEKVAGLTIKSVAIGLIIVLVMSAAYGSLSTIMILPLGYQAIWGLIFIVSLVFALINFIKPGCFTAQEVAVISIMIMAGMAWFTIYMGNQLLWIALFATPSTVMLNHPTLPNFPDWLWGPKDVQIVESIFPVSTLNINFGAFAQSLGWFYLLMISMFLAYICLIVLLRGIYIVREALPYPLVTFQELPITMTQRGEKKRLKIMEMKLFLLGWLIGFLWLIPWPIYDGRYDLLGAPLPPELAWLTRGFDYTPLGLIPWVALGVRSPAELLPNIFFALLWPIEALYGWVFGWLLLAVIVPNIWYALGWLPPWQTGYSYWAIKFGWEMNALSPYFQNYNDGVSLGIIFVLTFYPLWRHRDSFKRILSGFYKGIPEDAGSPIPYRYAWWGLIIFSLLAVVGWSWMGLPWYLALYLMTIILIYLPGCIYALGETLGTSPFYINRGGWVDIWQNWPPQTVSVCILRSMGGFGVYGSPVNNATTFLFLSYNEGYYALFGGLVTPSLLAFKVADDTKINVKSVFKILVISTIISIFVASIGMIIWVHWYPIRPGTRPYTMVAWTWFSGQLRNGMTANPWPGFLRFPRNTAEIWATVQSIVLGVVYALAVYLARIRFPWFRVSPAGTLLMINFEWCMNWLPFILATVIKYLVIRVGGYERFNRYVFPLAAGVCIGTFTVNAIVFLQAPFATGAYTLPA